MSGNPTLENPFVQSVFKSWDYAFRGKLAAIDALLRVVKRVGPLAEGDEIMKEVRDLALAGVDRDLCPRCFGEAVPQKNETGEKDSEKPEVQAVELSPETEKKVMRGLKEMLDTAAKANKCLDEMQEVLDKAFMALGMKVEPVPEEKETGEKNEGGEGEASFVCSECGGVWREKEILRGGNKVVYGSGPVGSLGKREVEKAEG